MLRPIGNVVNRIFGQANYEKVANSWFHTKMRFNFTNDNVKYLRNIIDRGDFCLDIGANRGEITYYMSRLVGNSGKVISFEPVSKARTLLKDTIKTFNLNNVTVSSIALSDEVGKFDMFIPNLNGVACFALANLVKRDSESSTSEGYYETVGVDTIDNIIGDISPTNFSFIKCDVEGHELAVFKGGEQTIEKYKPIVLVEIWASNHIIKDNIVTSELMELFKKYNYVAKFVHGDKLMDLDAELIKANKIQDFLLIPKCKLGMFS